MGDLEGGTSVRAVYPATATPVYLALLLSDASAPLALSLTARFLVSFLISLYYYFTRASTPFTLSYPIELDTNGVSVL